MNNITEMLNGNKVEWRNWASSVLQEISKVLMNAAIVNGIKTAANGMSGAGGFIGSIGDWLGGAVLMQRRRVYLGKPECVQQQHCGHAHVLCVCKRGRADGGSRT